MGSTWPFFFFNWSGDRIIYNYMITHQPGSVSDICQILINRAGAIDLSDTWKWAYLPDYICYLTDYIWLCGSAATGYPRRRVVG